MYFGDPLAGSNDLPMEGGGGGFEEDEEEAATCSCLQTRHEAQALGRVDGRGSER